MEKSVEKFNIDLNIAGVIQRPIPTQKESQRLSANGKMQLVGTVVIVNRLAQSVGCGSTSKLNRPCKGFLQVRNRGDGQQILMISTRKDVTAYEYNVMDREI